jgi:hypothetical protein
VPIDHMEKSEAEAGPGVPGVTQTDIDRGEGGVAKPVTIVAKAATLGSRSNALNWACAPHL